MHRRHLSSAALLTALLLLCSSVVRAAISIPDPAGDTFGSGPIQHDILSVTSTINPTNVVFDVSFAGPIAPASAFSAGSLVGFLDLDIDQSSATGASARLGAPATPTVISGIEYYVDLFSESFTPGTVDIINASTGLPTGSAAISYSPTSFSLTLPFSLIGNDDGFLNYGLVAGTFSEATDQATGSTSPLVTDGVPEHASAIAWVTLCVIAGSLIVHRRRRPAIRRSISRTTDRTRRRGGLLAGRGGRGRGLPVWSCLE